MEQPQEYVVQDRDLNLRQIQYLVAFYIFKHAIADLLLRYLRLNTLRYLQTHLAALHAAEEKDRYIEYLIPVKPPHARFGSSPYVYTFGRRGHAFFKKQGFPVGRYRTPDAGVQQDVPLRHRLAVNEFLFKAIQLAEDQPQDVQLIQRIHEQYWNGNPLKVTLPGEIKPVGLSTDLLVAFETNTPHNEQRFPVEVNLSREWKKDWAAKVRAYLACMPAYQERLGTDILTIIPVLVASPAAFPRNVYVKESSALLAERARQAQERQRRMERLKQWTEHIPTKMNLQYEADLFSFSAAPTGRADTAEVIPSTFV